MRILDRFFGNFDGFSRRTPSPKIGSLPFVANSNLRPGKKAYIIVTRELKAFGVIFFAPTAIVGRISTWSSRKTTDVVLASYLSSAWCKYICRGLLKIKCEGTDKPMLEHFFVTRLRMQGLLCPRHKTCSCECASLFFYLCTVQCITNESLCINITGIRFMQVLLTKLCITNYTSCPRRIESIGMLTSPLCTSP